MNLNFNFRFPLIFQVSQFDLWIGYLVYVWSESESENLYKYINTWLKLYINWALIGKHGLIPLARHEMNLISCQHELANCM